jgi:hypothetical protein
MGVLLRARRATTRLVAALAWLATAAPRPAHAHPLHTTLAELSYDPASRVLDVSLRVFADDFAAAVARRAGARTVGALPPDSAMFRYVAERFALAAPGAGPVALRWCGVRRSGDVLLLCLRATAVPALAGVRVRSTLLHELFTDQVNLVQASYGGRRRMLMFTPGTGAKPLP